MRDQLAERWFSFLSAPTRWLGAFVVGSATSAVTIRSCGAFARFGLPELVTDNGSVFTSSEFEEFTKKNGIRHLRSAPYHPATNGLAERAVQSIKSGLKKSGDGTLETKLSRFLFQYRLTPHSTTGVSPAELLLGRRPRSHLDQIRPDLRSKVQKQLDRLKQDHDRIRGKHFVRETPCLCNFASGPVWLSGTIERLRDLCLLIFGLSMAELCTGTLDIYVRDTPVSVESAPVLDTADVVLDLPPGQSIIHSESLSRLLDVSVPSIPPRRSTRDVDPQIGWDIDMLLLKGEECCEHNLELVQALLVVYHLIVYTILHYHALSCTLLHHIDSIMLLVMERRRSFISLSYFSFL